MAFGDRDYYRPSGFGRFSFFPPVLKYILISNVIVFFVMILSAQVYVNGPITLYDYIMKYFALIPLSGGGIYIEKAGGALPASFLPWQLVTYQFMHDISHFSHILFNMFILWMFGMEIENIWGSKKFLLFYLLAGIGAGLAQILFTGGSAPTIGASGAVYGVMIAFAMFFPDRLVFIYFLIPIKAKYLIAILMVFEFMSVGDMSFVAHIAHIGGALTGAIFILLDKRKSFDVEGFSRKISAWFSSLKTSSTVRPPGRSGKSIYEKDIKDAEFYDINNKNDENDETVSQQEIDRILDKISEGGYQSLSEHEKKVLFEISKKS